MKKPNIKGNIICFDGPDGSGKSTQLKEVAKYLRDKGYNVLELRQPGMPGEHGDNIRKALFGRDRYRDFWAVRMLFAAEHLEFMDRYGYREDEVILCDRSVPVSNSCIGGAEYRNLEEVMNTLAPIYNLADRNADTIIIFSVTPETVEQRLQSRLGEGGEINHYDQQEKAFHIASCNNYNLMEEIDEISPKLLGLSDIKKTIYSVDANLSQEEVRNNTISLLNEIYDI